jgi:hypothetical protein
LNVQAFEQGKAAKAGAGTLEKTEEEQSAADASHERSESKDMEASMWPALYMLEAYVRLFNSRVHTPDAAS